MVATIDWGRVTKLWAASGRTPLTIGTYLYWARRFEAHSRASGRDPIARLTVEDVRRFAKTIGLRRSAGSGREPVVEGAARALSYALAALGHSVPTWSSARPAPRLIPSVERYIQHRLRHRGISKRTSRIDALCVTTFMRFLTTRRRNLRTIRIVDIDAFVLSRSKVFAANTLAGMCSTLRAFLRYLHLIGVTETDFATHVAAPRVRAADRPPRALPWNDVRRILRAIDTTTVLGPRDSALFLMMATYGMGAAEVIGLRLDDLDWRSRRIRLRRPKTGIVTELPLLDPVARALATYLRRSRPAHASTRAVFVSDHLPHGPLSGAAVIQHRLALYAHRAGIRAGPLGTHLFRHSHATRQIELGQSAKVVGDILGHRRPESTSVYTRSAVLRLRAVALPVPR